MRTRSSPRPARRLRLAAAGGLGTAVTIAILLASVASAVTFAPTTAIRLSHGGTMSGQGDLGYCSSGLVNNTTGWVCDRATVLHGVGSARGWDQLQANVEMSNLSGWHDFWATGALNLSTGYAQVKVSCLPGGASDARVYVYWHVWVYDRTMGMYVDQSNSGYIWDSGSYTCPSGGGSVLVSSPKLYLSFNSSSYATFGYHFVAGHTYLFTSFLGCTAQAQVTTSMPGSPAVAGAFCNLPSSASANTFTLHDVVVG